MPTLYEKAPETVYKQAQELVRQYHPGIEEAGVKVDYLFAFAPADDTGEPTGPAIKWRGLAAYGLCRILSLKDRAMGRGDAEIILDGDKWKDWDPERQNALIDHELTHISIVTNQKGAIQTDDLTRPKLKLRKHDFEVGWFHSIAQRHGAHSFEVEQAKRLQSEAGEFYFQPELRLVEGRAA
jgi:hypothetical protein